MTDWIGELERLRVLKEAGHLSEKEFLDAKARVMTTPVLPEPMQAQAPHSSPAASPTETDQWEPYVAPEGVEPSRTAPILLVLGALLLLGGGAYVGTSALNWGGEAETRETSVDVNCRLKPSADAAIKTTIAQGTRVALTDIDGSWRKERQQGCWINASNTIATDLESSTSPSSTATAASTAVASERETTRIAGGAVETQIQNDLLARAASEKCPGLILMGGANACAAQMSRNFARGSDDERRVSEIVRAVESNLNRRCSASDLNWYQRYSTDLTTRAMRELGPKAAYAGSQSQILNIAQQTCTNIAFDDRFSPD